MASAQHKAAGTSRQRLADDSIEEPLLDVPNSPVIGGKREEAGDFQLGVSQLSEPHLEEPELLLLVLESEGRIHPSMHLMHIIWINPTPAAATSPANTCGGAEAGSKISNELAFPPFDLALESLSTHVVGYLVPRPLGLQAKRILKVRQLCPGREVVGVGLKEPILDPTQLREDLFEKSMRHDCYFPRRTRISPTGSWGVLDPPRPPCGSATFPAVSDVNCVGVVSPGRLSALVRLCF